MSAANLRLIFALNVSMKRTRLEHGFFAMNMPKLIHTPNMASLFHYSIRHAWECAGMKVPPNHHTEMKLLATFKYLISAFAGVVARAVVAKSPKGEPSRDIESLPLASLGDFVRGRMGEAGRQAEGLFESLLSENFA